jgi:hypothetical protein
MPSFSRVALVTRATPAARFLASALLSERLIGIANSVHVVNTSLTRISETSDVCRAPN